MTLHGRTPLILKQPIISRAMPVIISKAHATLVVIFTRPLHLHRIAQHQVPRIEIALNI
jgi:hypothetical protein